MVTILITSYYLKNLWVSSLGVVGGQGRVHLAKASKGVIALISCSVAAFWATDGGFLDLQPQGPNRWGFLGPRPFKPSEYWDYLENPGTE